MGAASDSVIDEYMQEENMISPFNIEIAGKSVRIEPMYGCIHEYCRGFVTDKEADTIVSISQADIDFERKKSESEDIKEGIPIRHFTDEYLETLAVYRKNSG